MSHPKAMEEAGADPAGPGSSAEIELRMLELQHRLKNILAVVQSLANETLQDGMTMAEARQALAGRLAAIGQAVDLLLSGAWQAASLADLVRSAMTVGGDRLRIDGPRIGVGPAAAMMLSILFHELACNSAKYGALSLPSGRVEVSWRKDETRLVLAWRERGGPPIQAPAELGFGSTLVAKIAMRLGAEVGADFDPAGLQWRFSAPLPALEP